MSLVAEGQDDSAALSIAANRASKINQLKTGYPLIAKRYAVALLFDVCDHIANGGAIHPNLAQQLCNIAINAHDIATREV